MHTLVTAQSRRLLTNSKIKCHIQYLQPSLNPNHYPNPNSIPYPNPNPNPNPTPYPQRLAEGMSQGAPWEFNLRDVFRWLDRAGDRGGAVELELGGEGEGEMVWDQGWGGVVMAANHTGDDAGDGDGEVRGLDAAHRLLSDAAWSLFVCRLRCPADRDRARLCYLGIRSP